METILDYIIEEVKITPENIRPGFLRRDPTQVHR